MRAVVRLEQWENLILRRKINLDKRRLVFSEIKQAFGEEEKAYCIFSEKRTKRCFSLPRIIWSATAILQMIFSYCVRLCALHNK